MTSADAIDEARFGPEYPSLEPASNDDEMQAENAPVMKAARVAGVASTVVMWVFLAYVVALGRALSPVEAIGAMIGFPSAVVASYAVALLLLRRSRKEGA